MTPSHSALRRRVVRSRVIGVLAGLQLFTLPAHGQVESAPYLKLRDDSHVFTKARSAEGGDIIVEASETIELVSASVETQVNTGRGNAGEITVRGSEVPGSPVGAIMLNDGKILSTAKEGNGGDISIVARGYLPSGDSVVDASSDDSIDGKIVVRAPANDLTSEVAALPVELLDTAALVASACGPGAVQGASFQVQRRLAPPLPPDVSAAWRPAARVSGRDPTGRGARLSQRVDHGDAGAGTSFNRRSHRFAGPRADAPLEKCRMKLN